MNETAQPAVAGPVVRVVRPRAWMMVNPTHMPESRSLHWQQQEWHITWEAEPLYDQAAIDAAVAAERERCAKLCDDIGRIGPEAAFTAGKCAAAIKGPNVKWANHP